MKMYASTAFAKLSVSSRPSRSSNKITIKRFLSFLVRNIKVNDYMILRNFHIVKLIGINIQKLGCDIVPFFAGRLFCRGVLSQTVSAFLIKYRFYSIEIYPGSVLIIARCFFFWIFEFVCSETTIVAPKFRTIICNKLFAIVPEIVFKLLFEVSFRIWITYLCFVAISVIHLPSSLQTCTVFSFENVIRVNNEVVEVVRRAEHCNWNIVIVSSRIFQIDISAMTSNTSELERNLLHSILIIPRTKFISGWSYVN